MSKANADRVDTTNVVATQHIDATGKVQPAGELATNPIHAAIGDGAETVDVETVEADIDGVNAATTNSLIYGRESSGVTHPVHVDAQGDVHVITTPGATLEPTVYTTGSCAAGAAVEFNIAFADLAILEQIQIEQLTAGNYNYIFEVWKSATYIPGTMTDHHLKIFSRDVNQREWGEIIDGGGLRYRDDDGGAELHCRIANDAAGTTSPFNVTVFGVEG